MMELDVDTATAERLLGRKLTALDRFLGLATDKAIKLVETSLRARVKPIRRPQNIQDAPRRTVPRVNPVHVKREGSDGLVYLRPHVTSARSPVVQALFQQLGLGAQLVRSGLWMDPNRIVRDPITGNFAGSVRNNGYTSRSGLRFYRFSRTPGLEEWARNKDKGTQALRHTVRLTSPDVRIKLILAPTVKFCRQRVFALFEAATKEAMDAQ
jgi:hypothetical protein